MRLGGQSFDTGVETYSSSWGKAEPYRGDISPFSKRFRERFAGHYVVNIAYFVLLLINCDI